MNRERAVWATGLVKRYGPVTALDGVDLEVRTGTVLGLLGPNGAGKTTVVRILATLLSPDSGSASVAGADVVTDAATVRRAIGLSGQYAALDAYLTGRENLVMIGRLSGLGRRRARRRAAELLEMFDLGGAADRVAGGYSGGMRRRLDVAASLVSEPAVLFLDEPTTGLDPLGRMELWRMVSELVVKGTTVLLTTQYLEEADRLADAIVVMDSGRVIASGTADELRACVGGDRLELRPAAGTDISALAAAVARLGSGAPVADSLTGMVVMPVTSGPAVLDGVSTSLAVAGVEATSVALRRPSLDEVFLTLTGRHAAGATSLATKEAPS